MLSQQLYTSMERDFIELELEPYHLGIELQVYGVEYN